MLFLPLKGHSRQNGKVSFLKLKGHSVQIRKGSFLELKGLEDNLGTAGVRVH